MTREELEKEATEYALEWGDKTDGTYACCRDGFLAGAEPREKRIEELKKENEKLKEQIEQMKCCGNCTKGNCVNIGQKGKACAYWTSNVLRR